MAQDGPSTTVVTMEGMSEMMEGIATLLKTELEPVDEFGSPGEKMGNSCRGKGQLVELTTWQRSDFEP
jgi:hypothetical protein